MTVDLNETRKENSPAIPGHEDQTNYDHWNVKKGDETHYVTHEVVEAPRSYHVHLDLEGDSDPSIEAALVETFKVPLTLHTIKEEIHDEIKQTETNDCAPLVTHTLVDLYCGQGHIEKALEVLEKILLFNPNDQKTIKKIKEIKALVQPLNEYDEEDKNLYEEYNYTENYTTKHQEPKLKPVLPGIHLVEIIALEQVSEEEGRRHLMSLFDEKLGAIEFEDESVKKASVRLIEEKLTLFLKKIQKRALDYQGRV